MRPRTADDNRRLAWLGVKIVVTAAAWAVVATYLGWPGIFGILAGVVTALVMS